MNAIIQSILHMHIPLLCSRPCGHLTPCVASRGAPAQGEAEHRARTDKSAASQRLLLCLPHLRSRHKPTQLGGNSEISPPSPRPACPSCEPSTARLGLRPSALCILLTRCRIECDLGVENILVGCTSYVPSSIGSLHAGLEQHGSAAILHAGALHIDMAWQ